MSWQVKSPTPPPGYCYGSRYGASWANIIRGVSYILLGRPRSLSRDASYALMQTPVPPLVRLADNIPETGPLVLLANHYERPGLWMVWPAFLAGHLVRERTGRDTHWIAIQEWESFSVWRIPVPPSIIRRVFERAFHTYGIIAMPSADTPAAGRASSMRAAAQLVHEGQIIGLMPEGDVGPTPELLEAREGVGSFLLLLAGRGARMLPVGIYEEDQRLVAHFGPAFELTAPTDLPKADRDQWARDRVMLAIRALLPEPLWGVYRAKG